MIPVGILGATGMVGQQYVNLLSEHPWFEITFLAASERSANKPFEEAIKARNFLKKPLSKALKELKVEALSSEKILLNHAKKKCRFVFSALDTDSAKIFEELFASASLPVVSNASAYRNTPDIPVLIPEINPEHLEIIPKQQKLRGWNEGFIVTKPNCSLQSYLAPLFALHKHFPIKTVIVTTMQAISGAGWPGVPSYDILGNVIPYISGEEEKSELEPLKILGKIRGDEIVACSDLSISAHCNRVPVIDGHTACVSLKFDKAIPEILEILDLWKNFQALPQKLNLPSAPKNPIVYREEINRPQPRLDVELENGMATFTGRLRACKALDIRFVGLSHNTVRGAAGGGILNAELLKSLGYFD